MYFHIRWNYQIYGRTWYNLVEFVGRTRRRMICDFGDGGGYWRNDCGRWRNCDGGRMGGEAWRCLVSAGIEQRVH